MKRTDIDICEEIQKTKYNSLSTKKKECRDASVCYYNNKIGKFGKCVIKKSSNLRDPIHDHSKEEPPDKVAEVLDVSRQKDFDRTFQDDESLKTIAYRLVQKYRLINRKLDFSHLNYQQGIPFHLENNFIRSNPPCDFIDIVKEVKYLGSGNYGHAFQICPHVDCKPEFILKLIPYNLPVSGDKSWDYTLLDITNPLRGENVEVLQASYLESLLIRAPGQIISPHISLSVMAFRCSYQSKSVQELLRQVNRKDGTKYLITNELYKRSNGDLKHSSANPDSEILIYISEFAKFGDFTSWLENKNPTPDQLNIFIFQLIFTFACIQKQDPSYRHNDLSCPNVLIQEIEVPAEYRGHYYHYEFSGKHYLIPVTNFSLRLWDMDFSNSNSVPNRKVFCGPIQNKQEYGLKPNQQCSTNIYPFYDYGILGMNSLQYDLSYFFCWMRLYTKYYRDILRDGDLKDFIRSWSNFTTEGNRVAGIKLIDNARLTASVQLFLEEDLIIATEYKDKHPDIYEADGISMWTDFKHNPKFNYLPKPSIWTTCYSKDGNVDVPLSEYTAEHCLLHCKIFTKFIVSDSELQDKLDKGLILANYILS